MVEDCAVAAFVVFVGAVAEDIRVVVGFTAVVVEASVVKDSGVVVGEIFSVAGGTENTGMVVGFLAAVVEASVVEDCAVAVGAALVAVEGAVVVGEDMSVVLGVTAVFV